MLKKMISSILVITILTMVTPIQQINKVLALENNARIGVTTIDLTGLVTGTDANHNHIYEKKYNNKQHWEQCWICNNKINVKNHNLTTIGTKGCAAGYGTQSQYCTDGCGYNVKLAKVPHSNISQWKSDPSHQLHYKTCGVCGGWTSSQNCYNSSGQEIGCRTGIAGTCVVCGQYLDGTHRTITNGSCDQCYTKLVETTLRTEVLEESKVRVIATFQSNSNINFETDRTYASTNSAPLPGDWDMKVESSSWSGDVFTIKGIYTANDTSPAKSITGIVGTYYNNSSGRWAIRNIVAVSPDNYKPTKKSNIVTGNGSIGNFNNKARITATYTDTWKSQHNIVYMRLIDKNKSTVIADWGAATRNGTTYTRTFDVVSEIREPANVYVQVKDACGNITTLEDGAVKVQYIDALAPRLTGGKTSSTNWSKNKEITYTTLDQGVGRSTNRI